ncbi:glycosyl transferase family protein [Alteromonadaceae bacterium BrNp21-10]|nr:glycosyl transferase family protein [Alteromonadaceae bacterium BrNp21-10]
MSEQFKPFIKAIGRGLKAGRSLTQAEAFDAFSLLLAGKVTAEQRGAFLMLLRVREETAEEIAGFVQACRLACNPDIAKLNVDLDMGCYAGKRRHLPWFVLSTLVLAQQGKRIFLHGTQEPETNRLYLSTVFPELGLPVATSAAQAKQQLDEFGLSYMDLVDINPPLNDIIQLRAQFGLRSCANTLTRMLNPSAAEFNLQGVFHRELDFKHANAAVMLQEPNVMCFRGDGGEVEINPERAGIIHVIRDGQHQQIDMPELLPQVQLKDRVFNTDELRQFWCGEFQSAYAEQAVIGTLAAQLLLLEAQPWDNAYAKAQQLWQQRTKAWPF